MIIPIGHDKGIHRQPWLSYGLIGVCLGVHLLGLWLVPDAERLAAAEQARQALLRELWQRHGAAWIAARRPDLATWPAAKRQRVPDDYRAVRDAFARELERGPLLSRADDDRRAWRRALERERRALGLLRYAHRPGEWNGTLVAYAFLHGGWLHLLGNMLFLWLCGCNLEDRWGRGWWGGLYLSGAVAAALSYGWWHDWDPNQGMVGASGAVAAAMGAFVVALGRARVRLLYVAWWGHLFVGTFTMPAYLAAPLWLLEQLFGMSFEGAAQPIGYSAHVGGFLWGAGFALLLRLLGLDRRLAGQSEEEATLRPAPPLYLRGVEQRERGDDAGARRSFEQLLAQQPHQPEAAFELFQLALRGGDREALGRAAERAFDNLHRAGDPALVRRVWQDLCRVDPLPRLNERAWLLLARCSLPDDRPTALHGYEQLAEQHADSPMRPKALLEAARLRLELHHGAAAVVHLGELLTRYPSTAYADQARTLIESYQLEVPAPAPPVSPVPPVPPTPPAP